MTNDGSPAGRSRASLVGAALIAVGVGSFLFAIGTPVFGLTVVGDGVQAGGDVQWPGVLQVPTLLVGGFLRLSGANRLRP